MQLRRTAIFCFLIVTMFCLNITLFSTVPGAPASPTLRQATFAKTIIQWTAVDGATTYHVYRDDVDVATVSGTEYTDTGLTANQSYHYRISAVNTDGESSCSPALAVKTLANLSDSNASTIQQVVDMINPNTVTAANLLGTVQSSFGLLGFTDTSLPNLDATLLQNMITHEYEAFSTAEESADTSTDTLDDVMAKYYKSHTFMDLYINAKLTELAEAHWQAGKKEPALGLYEKSLEYLPDVEAVVFNTLARMAYINFAGITTTSTHAEVVAALSVYRDTLNRYFQFFPNGGEAPECLTGVRMLLTHRHFQYFPQALDYAAYDQTSYDMALTNAQAIYAADNSAASAYRLSRIQAWKLGTMNVDFANTQGNAMLGTLTVKNVSNRNFVLANSDGDLDERIFNLTGTQLAIPIYQGHTYDLTAAFTVDGGNPLLYTVRAVPHALGQKTTYNMLNTPVTVALTNAAAPAEVHFIADRPTAPYNLKATLTGDTFTLSWDWTAPSTAYQLKEFRIYRGGALAGTVTTSSLANIPIASDYYSYTYTVKACDANNQLSDESPMLTVIPAMTAEELAYYKWKLQYFGNRPSAKEEDPDGDGNTNWEEYLAATNPTKAAPIRPALSKIGFTKIGLKWTAMDAVLTYRVYRDGTALALVNGTDYLDTDLTPDTTYHYQISAIGADGETDKSGITVIRTFSAVAGLNASLAQQVMEAVNLDEVTAANLMTKVQSAMSVVSSENNTLTAIDPALVQNMIDRDFEMLTSAEDSSDTSTDTLEQVMTQYYKNHNFLDLYVNYKLGELAEMHWQAGKKEIALGLYEKSLDYLTDVETIVLNTLSRIGYIQLAGITSASTHDEVVSAVAQYRSTLNRYFQFFPDGGSAAECKASVYLQLATNQFKHFPQLLEYDHYDQASFASALAAARAAKTDDTDKPGLARINRIAAWELGAMKVNFVNTQGTGVTGTLTVTNTTDKSLVLANTDDTLDTRTFNLTGSAVTIPVYLGHTYSLTATFPVDGGNPIVYTINNAPHAPGQKTTYNQFNAPLTETLSDTTAPAENLFITERPTFPYNLKAETTVDVFTLSWDWVAPSSDYQLKEFKVYRGGVEIGSTMTQSLANIPLNSDSMTYTYTVKACDVNGNLSADSPMMTVIPAMTSQMKTYYVWKVKYFGTSPSYAYEDPDHDGLTNWQEFQLGADPTQAPTSDPKSTVTNITQGTKVEYYDAGGSYNFPSLTGKTPYKTDTLTTFCFANNSGTILTSERSDDVAMVFKGYFDVPLTYQYKFYLSNDDGCKFYIDDILEINNDRNGSSQEFLKEVYLSAGVHSFRIEYHDYSGVARMLLSWSGKDFTRKSFDQSAWVTTDNTEAIDNFIACNRDSDNDGLIDSEEMKLGTDYQNADTDGDGISDGDEIHLYNTNPRNADTDGDGISDGEEIKQAGSDPLSPEMDFNNIQSVLKIPGADYITAGGGWQNVSGAAQATTIRGWVNYEVDLPADYLYRLRLNVKNAYTFACNADIRVFVDGVYLSKVVAALPASGSEDLFFYTPWVKAGKHQIKVFWDNHYVYAKLQVNEIEVQKIGGTDADSNGMVDWIEHNLNKICTVKEITASKTSPLCLEGTGKYIPLITINDTQTAKPCGPEKWYAAIDLNPTAAQTIAVSFQNGGKIINRNVTWTPTNIIQENGNTIKVRKNDSLLLNAFPAGTTSGSYQIQGNGQNFNGEIGTPQAMKFTVAGDYTITGEYVNGTSSASGTITVKVIDYAFGSEQPACWIDRPRSWDIATPPDDIVIVPDERLKSFEKSSVTLANAIRYNLTADDNQERYVTARLGSGGPIIDCKTINGFSVFSSNTTYVRQVDEYSDGTKLYEMLVIASPVLSGVELHFNIFVSGVLFDNGTTYKCLTAADFNAVGEAKVYFLYSPTAKTSTCHNLQAFQNGIYIGIRY